MTRKEAIEVYNGLINTKIKEAFEFFAPELRESEDERIRKALICGLSEGLSEHNWQGFGGATIDECLAYLEKQKEQKPSITGNDFGWIDELKHDLEHPEELDQKVDDVLKQRKGRSLGWSEDDEKIYKTIYNHFHSFNQWTCSNGVTQNDVIRFLNSLKNRCNFPSWKPSEKQMRQLGYVAEQNKHNMLGKELMTLYNDLKNYCDGKIH